MKTGILAARPSTFVERLMGRTLRRTRGRKRILEKASVFHRYVFSSSAAL